MKTVAHPGDVLTLVEVRELLSVSAATVHEWIHRKKNPLPHYALGGRVYRVERTDLEAWLASQKRGGAR